jgi:hypothetical protein
LLLDKNFNLDSNEKKFFKLNIKLPKYYLAAEVYDNFEYALEQNIKLKKLIDELNKSEDPIEVVEAIIFSAPTINKLLGFPKIYIDYIKKNKDMILKKKLLKFNLTKSKNKNNVYLLN